MNILITGASGFIGQSLIPKLSQKGHSLVLLTRNPPLLKKLYNNTHRVYHWDALTAPPPEKALINIDAIINLMGEGIAERRWTKKQKEKIVNTRVIGTKNIIKGIKKTEKKPTLFITISAIGYYDHSLKIPITESTPPSSSFLSTLCQNWEKEASQSKQIKGLRYICLRLGLVIGRGGALSKMILPFSLGLGAKLGSGKQWMNWVHLDDLIQIITLSLENTSITGAYNIVSPKNCTNETFSKTLAAQLKRPLLLVIPSFVLNLLLGELSQELLQGQKALPKRLEEKTFNFKYPDIKSALKHTLENK